MKKVVVKKSSIHGNGLFADESIKAGEDIIWIFRSNGHENIANPFGGKVNHSDNPNAVPDLVNDGKEVRIKSNKDIDAGDEITIHYGDWNKNLPLKYNTEDFREPNQKVKQALKAIAEVIVKDRKELIEKLDQLGISCSCSLFDATEEDLSDIVVDNLWNKSLVSWLEKKIADKNEYHNIEPVVIGAIITGVSAIVGSAVKGSQAKKQRIAEYKKLLTKEAVEARKREEEKKRIERERNNKIVIGASFAVIVIGGLIFLGLNAVKPISK